MGIHTQTLPLLSLSRPHTLSRLLSHTIANLYLTCNGFAVANLHGNLLQLIGKSLQHQRCLGPAAQRARMKFPPRSNSSEAHAEGQRSARAIGIINTARTYAMAVTFPLGSQPHAQPHAHTHARTSPPASTLTHTHLPCAHSHEDTLIQSDVSTARSALISASRSH